MKKTRKNMVWITFFSVLTGCFLFYSEKTTKFAYIGLDTWFHQMIISLFPFMVLMNLLILSGLSESFIYPVYILLKPIYKNTKSAVFVIFFGFLSGFPLGAKCATDLIKSKKISKTNAEYLLCFCNNIGPAYMLGFFIHTISPGFPLSEASFYFYIVPLFYGIFLRYTLYKKPLDDEYKRSFQKEIKLRSGHIKSSGRSVVSCLPDAVTKSLEQIAVLGGYMIVFNAFRIIPHVFLQNFPAFYVVVQSLLEISGGLLCVKQSIPAGFWRETALCLVFVFNGICCHCQTFATMEKAGLSKQKYMLHKLILCSITFFIRLFLEIWN